MDTADRVFLTVPEVAKLIGVSRVRAYQLIERGAIPATRLSARRIRIPRPAFEAWLSEQSERALATVRTANDQGLVEEMETT